MTDEESPVDIGHAHRHFSKECFNRTWTLIEKAKRTPAEDEEMLLTAAASLWHWMQRPDRTDINLSIGHWQLSRVYSLVGRGDDSMRHAEQSLQFATGSSPFYKGYAHEAIARAALALKNESLYDKHIHEAKKLAANITDPNAKAQLLKDLDTVTDWWVGRTCGEGVYQPTPDER